MKRGVIVVGVFAQFLSLIACGSGGSDPSSASSSGGSSSTSSSSGSSGASSSGGSSSGGTSNGGCDAICVGGARILVEEDNTGDRLDKSTVTACKGPTECATGILGKNYKGVYSLSLVKAKDQNSPPSIQVNVTAPTASALRIEIIWDYGQDGTKLVDGDAYSVAGRAGDGPMLFERSFTATYGQETVCGSTCKLYRGGP